MSDKQHIAGNDFLPFLHRLLFATLPSFNLYFDVICRANHILKWDKRYSCLCIYAIPFLYVLSDFGKCWDDTSP